MNTKIKILVQNNGESAADFANRIEKFIYDFKRDCTLASKKCVDETISFTTASDGKQTANMVFKVV